MAQKSWAWIAGASEGLGLAYAEELARRGNALVMFARRTALLQEHAKRISEQNGVSVHAVALDLTVSDLAARLTIELNERPPAIAVYNAAFAPAGDYLEQSLDDLTRVVDVNIRGPMIWSHVLGRDMLRRGQGVLIFMSSLAGEQGSPRIAAYAASKAFNTRLAEGLWAELRASGVDVLVCCAGAISTPGYLAAAADTALGTLAPEVVVRSTLDRIGHGPRVIPGWTNKVASLLLGRWLPRSWAVRVMQSATASLVQNTEI